MELHKALRNIIKTDGPEILRDIRLVNILDDFNAYQDIPASKYILRAIISDGYSERMLAHSQWDVTTEQLVSRFVTTTGFIPESVYKIYLSMAYGLGIIGDNDFNAFINAKSTSMSSTSSKPSQPVKASQWSNKMTEDQKEQYIYSLLEYDNSKENLLHVKIENLYFEVNTKEEVSIHCEFRKTGKVPGTGYAWLHYALYDLRGRMKDTGLVNCMTNSESNPKPVMDRWTSLTASQLGKIRLYWEK